MNAPTHLTGAKQAPTVRLGFGAASEARGGSRRHQPTIISKERMMAAKTKWAEKS
jgi:hypothetical protein